MNLIIFKQNQAFLTNLRLSIIKAQSLVQKIPSLEGISPKILKKLKKVKFSIEKARRKSNFFIKCY